MSIAIDAISSSLSPIYTWSHTVAGGGSLLLVFISRGSRTVVNGVTFNGVSMTLSYTHASIGPQAIDVFSLISPDSGAHDIVADIPGGTDFLNNCLGAISFTGTHLTAPFTDAGSSDTNGSNTVASATISSSVNDICLFSAAINTGEDCDFTEGAGQSNRITAEATTVRALVVSSKAGAATQSMTITADAVFGVTAAQYILSLAPNTDRTGSLNCNSPRYSSSGWANTGPVGTVAIGDNTIPSFSAFGTGSIPTSSSITGTSNNITFPSFTSEGARGFSASLSEELPPRIGTGLVGATLIAARSAYTFTGTARTEPRGNVDTFYTTFPGWISTGQAFVGFVASMPSSSILSKRAAYTATGEAYINPIGSLQQSFPKGFTCFGTGIQSGLFDTTILQYTRD